MKPSLWFTLYKLAEMGACNRTIRVSTEYLAEKLGCSQQTASRHLIKLERGGLIIRAISLEGCLIKIGDPGMDELKKVYSGLQSALETAYFPSIILEGELFTGFGEGAYYITREGYRNQFIEKLGFDPYPGTLNIKLGSDYDVKMRSEIDSYPAIEIKGFSDKERTFGPVKCYRVIINNKVNGAVVVALRGHYNKSVMEIIASINLRRRFKLKDGHKVKLEILTSQ